MLVRKRSPLQVMSPCYRDDTHLRIYVYAKYLILMKIPVLKKPSRVQFRQMRMVNLSAKSWVLVTRQKKAPSTKLFKKRCPRQVRLRCCHDDTYVRIRVHIKALTHMVIAATHMVIAALHTTRQTDPNQQLRQIQVPQVRKMSSLLPCALNSSRQ